MKFLSLDIETTGLNPEENNVIEVGCITYDTETNEKIKKHWFVKHEQYVGSDYAIAMNARVFDVLSEREPLPENSKIIHAENFALDFEDYLFNECHFEFNKSITVAGKNVAGFDIPFIKNLIRHSFLEVDSIKFKHRTIDPAILFWNPITDDSLPDLATCIERSGIDMNGRILHNALDDAELVVDLLERKLKLKKQAYSHILNGSLDGLSVQNKKVATQISLLQSYTERLKEQAGTEDANNLNVNIPYPGTENVLTNLLQNQEISMSLKDREIIENELYTKRPTVYGAEKYIPTKELLKKPFEASLNDSLQYATSRKQESEVLNFIVLLYNELGPYKKIKFITDEVKSYPLYICTINKKTHKLEEQVKNVAEQILNEINKKENEFLLKSIFLLELSENGYNIFVEGGFSQHLYVDYFGQLDRGFEVTDLKAFDETNLISFERIKETIEFYFKSIKIQDVEVLGGNVNNLTLGSYVIFYPEDNYTFVNIVQKLKEMTNVENKAKLFYSIQKSNNLLLTIYQQTN